MSESEENKIADGVDVSAVAGPSGISIDDEPNDWTCAICLDSVATANLAVVKGCGHTYCVNCIVHWASTRTAEPRCPTCKAPFTQLMCHKQLDGSFSGVPVEESVVLLARSAWFQDWLVEREHVKQLSRSNPGLVPPAPQQPVQRSEQALLQEEWAEEALYGYFESQYDDDDEFEDMYLSRSGPRMAIGNRPHGPNGFLAAGRKLAAPKRPKTKGGKGEAGPSSKATASNGNQQAAGGRRAQRKAKRAAADAGASM